RCKADFTQRTGGFGAADDMTHAAQSLNKRRAAAGALCHGKKAAQPLAGEPDHILKRSGDELFDPTFALGRVVEIADLHQRTAQPGGALRLQKLGKKIEFTAFRHEDRQPVERGGHVTPPPSAGRLPQPAVFRVRERRSRNWCLPPVRRRSLPQLSASYRGSRCKPRLPPPKSRRKSFCPRGPSLVRVLRAARAGFSARAAGQAAATPFQPRGERRAAR